MPGEDRKQALHQQLVDRILGGPGRAPAGLRSRAFDNRELSEPLASLIGKIATNSAAVTDADFARASAAGASDDELFELVVCAAVGASTRQYRAGLAALAQAIAGDESA